MVKATDIEVTVAAKFEPSKLDFAKLVVGVDYASKVTNEQTVFATQIFDKLGVSSGASMALALKQTEIISKKLVEAHRQMGVAAHGFIEKMAQLGLAVNKERTREMEARDSGRRALGTTTLYCPRCEKVTAFDVFINNSSRPLDEHTIRAFCTDERRIAESVISNNGKELEMVDVPLVVQCSYEEKNDLRLAAAAARLLTRSLRRAMRKARRGRRGRPLRPHEDDMRLSTPFDASPEFRLQPWEKRRA